VLRTNVYVDGFNFYHGVVKDSPYKWLDLRALAQRLAPRNCTINDVTYFTARLTDSPNDPTISQRQDLFLRALEAEARVNVVLGKFRRQKFTLTLADGSGDEVQVWKTEEKGSDVNLATALVSDVLRNKVDAVMVISNDSDLQGALDLAVADGKVVIVVNPHHRTDPSGQLRGTAVRRIRRLHLQQSQLPDVVRLTNDMTALKPEEW